MYASPSVWRRMYLLWTFRNFHRLPQQVLDKRQRQLIETLGRTALVSRRGPIAVRPIIGSVEDVQITGIEKRSLASSEKLIAICPRAAVGRAVGSDSIPIARNRGVSGNVTKLPKPPTTDLPRPVWATKVQSIKSKLCSFTAPGRRTYVRRDLRGAVIVIACVALAALALRLSEDRYVSSISSPRPYSPEPHSGQSATGDMRRTR